MEKYKPDNAKYRGIYSHVAQNGAVTWYVRVKGKGPFLVSSANNINAEFAVKYRNYLINEYYVNGKLPVNPREKTYFDKWVQQKEAGEKTEINRYTVDLAWKEIFLPWAKRNQGKRTYNDHASKYRRHIKPHIGDNYLDEITTRMLDGLKDNWVQAGLSTGSQGQVMRTLSVFLKILKTLEGISGPHEAYQAIPRKISTKRRRLRTLTIEVVDNLLNEIKKLDKVLWYQCCIIGHAGLRPSEVLRLTPSNIDLDLNRINIFNVKNPLSKGLDRWVPITNKLRPILIAMLRTLNKMSSEMLFEPKFDYNTFYYAVDELGLNDGLERVRDRALWVSPYTLRHTFATLALNATGNIKRVQKLMGHKDLASTMVYLHSTDEDLYIAISDIDKVWEKSDSDRKKKFQIIKND